MDHKIDQILFSTLKIYRKIRKSKIKEYHRKIIDQLDSLLENNPKKYWSLLDDIANKTDNNKIPDITAGTWFDYFSNLNKKTNFSGKEDLIDKLKAIENEKNYSELDNMGRSPNYGRNRNIFHITNGLNSLHRK